MDLSENAQKIFKDLYCFQDETIPDAFKRVAYEFATNKTEQKTAYSLLMNNIWRPNTPVFLNSGTKHKIFSACYVVGLEDSMENIYDVANIARKIFQHGAGIGIPIGNLREAEAYIYEGEPEKAPEGKSSGPITFMKLYDAVGETTKSGGRVRRAAILCSLPVWHPDIMDFIECKKLDGRLENMNISVLITNKFMQSLEDNTPFDLITPQDGTKRGEMNPFDIWEKLAENAHLSAEPGVIFIDTVNKYNPLIKKMMINCTNPCVTGDMLIATADGRNAVSIKQLASENNDIPVYSTNNKGRVEIKMGRNPRKTGIKKAIWKVIFDNGSIFKATADHKLLTKDLEYVELKNLEIGQSIFPFNSFEGHNYRNICQSGKKMKNTRRNRNIHQDFRFGSFQNFKDLVMENHKVAAIEFAGFEDVYNITVDDNNNYHVITSTKDEKYITSSGICVKNCGEQPLLPFGCCNLSAINVYKFVRPDGEYDWDGLYQTAKKVMFLMDNVIDKMDFPDERFQENTYKYRPVGVGPMGVADALFGLGLAYDSAGGRKFAAEIMKTITTACVEASAILAEKHGPFHDFDIYRDDVLRIINEHIGANKHVMRLVQAHGVRNCQFTTAQPTGTTALSCDASYGIEPAMGLVFQKNLISGEKMIVANQIFHKKYSRETWYSQELIEKIFNNSGSLKGLHGIPKKVRETFVVAHDIAYRARIDMQAAIQQYCSTAISSTVNLPKEVTKEEIADLFQYSYEKGLKGVTIYRDGSKKGQPVTFNNTSNDKDWIRPNRLTSQTFTVETGNGKMYVTVSDDDGKPVEVFLNLGKSGQILNTFTEGIGRVISLALQQNVSLEKVTKTLSGINSDTIAWHRFEDSDARPVQILSIPDGIAKLLDKYYLNKTEFKESNGHSTSEICPKCSLTLVATEGCFSCSCGYSKCS